MDRAKAVLNFRSKESRSLAIKKIVKCFTVCMASGTSLDQAADETLVWFLNSIRASELPEAPESPRKMITKKQAAAMLSCSIKTVERLILAEKFTVIQVHSRLVRLLQDEVIEFVEKQVRKSRSAVPPK